MGLRLTQSVSRVLELPVKASSFYSDSTDVLWWIRGRGRDFRPYVANHIGEIQISTEPGQWQHISTDKNPADPCSRGTSPAELAESELWWSGPDCLMKEKSEWPKMELAETPRVMLEMKSTKKQQQESTTLVRVQENRAQRAKPSQGGSVPAWILNPKRISSWCRLVNTYMLE